MAMLPERRFHSSTRTIWREVAASPLVQSATDVTTFLHIPKSGGTSLSMAISRMAGWSFLDLAELEHPHPVDCGCDDPTCRERARRLFVVRHLMQFPSIDDTLWLLAGHDRYARIEDLSRYVSRTTARTHVVAVVRSTRARLVSNFRDFWSQVDNAVRFRLTGDASSFAYMDDALMRATNGSFLAHAQPHLVGGADALHDPDARVNARTWLESFGAHRTVPFFLSDIFDSPRQLAERLADRYR